MPVSNQRLSHRSKSHQRKAGGTRQTSSGYVLDLVIAPNSSEQPVGALPRRLLLVRSGKHDSSDQLYLDQVPVPREAWSFDSHDNVLMWRGVFGGGHLFLTQNSKRAIGNVRLGVSPVAVQASAFSVFDCQVAPDCGINYESVGDRLTNMIWDTSSQQWKGANWSHEGRFQLRYSYVAPTDPITPGSFKFSFTDAEASPDNPWNPTDFAASLKPASDTGAFTWHLSFRAGETPQRPDQPGGKPDTVFPYWLVATEDAAGRTISGAMVVDGEPGSGNLVGFQGTEANPAIAGYYRASASSTPFGVFDGRLVVAGHTVGSSAVRESALVWSELNSDQQVSTGLPASGRLQFSKDGAFASCTDTRLHVQRISASAAFRALEGDRNVHDTLASRLSDASKSIADPALNIHSLLVMTPYGRDAKNNWVETVQKAVTEDLSTIMNSFIDPDKWRLLFGSTPQPTLSGRLAEVANLPVPGEDPQKWYRSLGTAVLTQGMAQGSDEHCKNLNGPRAATWLKTEVAASKVYAAHAKALFAYHWQDQNNLTAAFLQDQIDNAQTYAPIIQGKIDDMVKDINTNVVPDPTQTDPRPQMIADVQSVGAYAKGNNLFWAFGFFYYNTSSSVLANIGQAMNDPGSNDSSMLARLFQTNVTVLTALDPSGTFAQQYNNILHAFLGTNTLANMTSFDDGATDLGIIKEYLQELVSNNLNNEDADIKAAAAQLQALVDSEDADAILSGSIQEINSISSSLQTTMAFPFMANRFATWFETAYPKWAKAGKFFGSVFLGGIAALNAFNLISSLKSWKKLTTEERAQLVTSAAQMGLQILAGVVKRGMRIGQIFTVEGLTPGQRAASVARIIADGEGGALEAGLVRTGNSLARWLGSTEGTSLINVSVDGATSAVMINSAQVAVEDCEWLTKAFGRNLDEFIATRIGPVFILAGIGFSLYSISKGEGGVSLASDVLGLTAGALTLFAMAGQWAIDGLMVTAEAFASIVAIAGPLAVLAAVAGVALMIYEMFQSPPDPVEQFVDDVAAPNGFKVDSQARSIDYVAPFANPDQGNLLMIGFTLATNGRVLASAADGVIALGQPSALPDTVWQVQTDGKGYSQIFTVVQPDVSRPPVLVKLSLMSDGTISFQPPVTPSSKVSSFLGRRTESRDPAGPTVTTQTWLSTPSNGTLASDGHLLSLDLTLQPSIADKDGKLIPTGWLAVNGDRLVSGASGTPLTLTVSGMAPNFMRMNDMPFPAGTVPKQEQEYGPVFGVQPSTPLSFDPIANLPEFLSLSQENGKLTPNGKPDGDKAAEFNLTMVARNAFGFGQASFSVVVGAS
ncbi:hypothetical protein [Paraburkholderia pallida]|uniref:Uncharacterized protein n=1 Tax=Paraburkholderia pallida TaxID=2547399 RepID=A0A4P7D4S4_9BURK|nr:hypothetical protein [Paraburkholderia pallida]QBR03766.1 hypothetical protein E1956_42525 [Paraburkholderia pallida]